MGKWLHPGGGDAEKSSGCGGGWGWLRNFLLEVCWSLSPLCDSIDCSPPGSSVHGILQARILGWVAISLSASWRKHHLIRGWTSQRRFGSCS